MSCGDQIYDQAVSHFISHTQGLSELRSQQRWFASPVPLHASTILLFKVCCYGFQLSIKEILLDLCRERKRQIIVTCFGKISLAQKQKGLTSTAHGGSTDNEMSANWFRSTLRGRNITTLDAIIVPSLKREYLESSPMIQSIKEKK